MSRPLLVQVIPTLGGGGAEREVVRVSPILKARSPFDVVVCCVAGRGVFADILEEAGVEVVVLGERGRPSFIDVVRFLRSRKPIISHSHLIRWGAAAAKVAGVPAAIMSEHSWSPPRGRVGVLFDRCNTWFADGVVAVSEATRQIRIDKWHTPKGKIATIPNAVDIDDLSQTVDLAGIRMQLGIAPGVPVVATVGRLIPIKAQNYFLDAASEVLKSRPDCRFLLVGDGPLRGDLEQQARELGILDSVNFLGFREDARDVMKIADVVCLSSLSEGMPITILEAMACAKPAVVTNVGGCPEAVQDGISGFVVPPRNASRFAHAINELIDNPGLAGRMGSAALERVRTEYSPETNLARLVEFYRRVLSQKGVELDSSSSSAEQQD